MWSRSHPKFNVTNNFFFRISTTYKIMSMEAYIEEKMKEFAMNIDEFSIGQMVTDSDGNQCEITDKSTTSIEVALKKKTVKGIDYKQWFDMKRFNNRFKSL